MGLSREIYQTLESIVGSENISDDPAICEADFKGGAGEFIHDRGAIRPACVILPGNTSEVREIVRVATRYNLPFIPFSTFYIAFCSPKRPNAIMMDLKRMNRLEIDDKNMYAIVEPGVSVSQLQAESMKRGLYVLSPGCGSQASVLANTAEHIEEIDLERAEAARRRAQARLHDRTQEKVDFARAEAALRRAMTRINVTKLHRRKGSRRAEASQAYELQR